jgi:hypothetical protein
VRGIDDREDAPPPPRRAPTHRERSRTIGIYEGRHAVGVVDVNRGQVAPVALQAHGEADVRDEREPGIGVLFTEDARVVTRALLPFRKERMLAPRLPFAWVLFRVFPSACAANGFAGIHHTTAALRMWTPSRSGKSTARYSRAHVACVINGRYVKNVPKAVLGSFKWLDMTQVRGLAVAIGNVVRSLDERAAAHFRLPTYDLELDPNKHPLADEPPPVSDDPTISPSGR